MTTPAARALAQRLADQHSALRSWRGVAALYPPAVKPGTISRIAGSGGSWLPKSKRILDALGFQRGRELTPMQVQIAQMAKATRQALKWKSS